MQESEEAMDQDVAESSPTPDFERNSDGKFRCSWPRCGKEFTVASRLTTHYRIHSGKPPYLCGYKDCQKAFHTSSSLSHHRVVHTDQGLRPYICRHNRCGATYTQLARLITHQRTTHSGMILFIPQESGSSSPLASAASSPAQLQSSAQTASTPSNHSQDASSPVVSPSETAQSIGRRNSTSPKHSPPPQSHNGFSPVHRRGPSDGQSAPTQPSSLKSPAVTEGTAKNKPGYNPVVDESRRSSEQDQQGQGSRSVMHSSDATSADNPEEEEEESNEMRLRKEAALTMASLALERSSHQDRSTFAGYTPSAVHDSHYERHLPQNQFQSQFSRHGQNGNGYYSEHYSYPQNAQYDHQQQAQSQSSHYPDTASPMEGPSSTDYWKYGPQSRSSSEFHSSPGYDQYYDRSMPPHNSQSSQNQQGYYEQLPHPVPQHHAHSQQQPTNQGIPQASRHPYP
ncbi:hypothetical protein BGZ83_006660 [Gryganskiella cystojenkinii]|nr:hypothetical protein BGZ83_006660 [Gryganskiella cystojenkinii]